MSHVNIDFEIRSQIDLPTRGLDVYANDPSTEVICMAYSVDGGPVHIWIPPMAMPAFMTDPTTTFQGWNIAFEVAIMRNVLGIPVKWENCTDSMAIAAANNIPQSLEDAAKFVNASHQKDTRGRYLIQHLCKPRKDGTFNRDPELLAEMYEYCKGDVRSEMAIINGNAQQGALRPLSASEHKIWCLTMSINDLGCPIAPYEVENAVQAVKNAQNAVDAECLALTGCKPSERAKLLAWLNDHGANMTDMTAETVTKMLQRNNLNPVVKRVLELRQNGSQTSVAKYAKILDIQREGRIRNTLVYHGASTGRWSSRGGLNLQNIARPSISDEQIAAAIPRVFDQATGTMDELSSLVRSAIKAPDGKTFVDADFSSIENRVAAWIAGQSDKVENFAKNLDEYKVFASEALYRVPYEEVTKDMRQISKSAVLGCVFGQGAKGLVKYAEGMGVNMSEAQAKNAVDSYRAAYPKVKSLWAMCEAAAIDAIQNPGIAKAANSKIKLKVAKGALWVQLPSGRLLCWQRPEVGLVTTPWGQERLGITAHTQNTYTREWKRNQLIGSSIFQSAVQATARDLLSEGLVRLENAGFETINLIHDEFLLLVDEADADNNLEQVIKLITTNPSWAPDIPLAAEGWVGKRYRK